MLITTESLDALLKAGKSPKGAWNKRQMEVLGVQWPPRKGWKARLIGTELSTVAAQNFVDLRTRPNDNPTFKEFKRDAAAHKNGRSPKDFPKHELHLQADGSYLSPVYTLDVSRWRK